jgi:hypothetical protein
VIAITAHQNVTVLTVFRQTLLFNISIQEKDSGAIQVSGRFIAQSNCAIQGKLRSRLTRGVKSRRYRRIVIGLLWHLCFRYMLRQQVSCGRV